MSNNNDKDNPFKVGDKIIRFGKVHEIFKIEEEENPQSGEVDEILYFKPVYETQANKSLVCSIAASNLELTEIRRPLSEEGLDELIEFLRSKIDMEGRFNTRSAKEVIKSNDPKKIAMILKKLAIVRRDPDTNFTYTKKRLFKRGVKKIREEIALVRDISIKEAHDLVLEILIEQAVKSFDIEEEESD